MEYKTDLIVPHEIKKGILRIENGLVSFEEKELNSETEYITSPTFFNSHIHLGDSIARDPPYMNLEKLVGPGGLKFKFLESGKDLSKSIRNSLEVAFSSGTTAIADFREGGLNGVEKLKTADLKRLCCPLTRPSNTEEAEKLLKDPYVEGVGMSSVRDHDIDFLEELRVMTKKKRKVFAIHAGELNQHDVDDAFGLEPDLLIHMNKASKNQLEHAIEEGIPIISCIRSNIFFRLENIENYKILSKYRKWCLGTDNVMIASPSMLEEMSFASFLTSNDIGVFKAAIRGFKIFGRSPSLLIFNKKSNLVNSLNPLSSIVRRATSADIEKIVAKSDFKSDLFEIYNL